MRLSAFVGRELSSVPLAEISAREWPFDLVAPLAAWYWIDTRFRAAGERAFPKLKSLEFDATVSCSSLDDVPLKIDERVLSDAYHRALLELLTPIHPRWQLECNDLGQLRFSGRDGHRLAGHQFGMLAILPDSRALAEHLEIDVVLLSNASQWPGMRQEVPQPRLARSHWRGPTQRR